MQPLGVKIELPLVGSIMCLNSHSGQICTMVNALNPCLLKIKQPVHYPLLLLDREVPRLRFSPGCADSNVRIFTPLSYFGSHQYS